MADGTGRDSYIQRNAGGLVVSYVPGKMVDNFLTSLRSGGPSASNRSRSYGGYKARKVPINKMADTFLKA